MLVLASYPEFFHGSNPFSNEQEFYFTECFYCWIQGDHFLSDWKSIGQMCQKCKFRKERPGS